MTRAVTGRATPGRAAQSALIVFAKAPLAGFAKTRLIPALGPNGAAALALRLLQHTVSTGMRAGFGHAELCVTPDTSHPVFQELAATHHMVLTQQGRGDLGERMARALGRRLAQGGRVLLIGTDSPALDADTLRAADLALETHDAVFVPALDGGYALVGLARPATSLFLNMTWSTAQVMAATRERLREANLSWAELAPVADIDEPADLRHLPDGWLE